MLWLLLHIKYIYVCSIKSDADLQTVEENLPQNVDNVESTKPTTMQKTVINHRSIILEEEEAFY